ncbi:hypothetical protein GCM10028783_42590 [Modestobacter muralis]
MLAESSAEDWNRIPGWGIGGAPVGPAFVNVEVTGDQGQVESWYARNFTDLLVFCPDVDLTVAYGLPAYYEDFERSRFDWAERHGWVVTTKFADVRWRGQVVDRVAMWATWKDVQVPVGEVESVEGSDVRFVERWQYAISAAVARWHGTESLLDTVLRGTEQQLRP